VLATCRVIAREIFGFAGVDVRDEIALGKRDMDCPWLFWTIHMEIRLSLKKNDDECLGWDDIRTDHTHGKVTIRGWDWHLGRSAMECFSE
jgi:hypothetical protein